MEPGTFRRNGVMPRAVPWVWTVLILPALLTLALPRLSRGEERTLSAEGRQALDGLNPQEARALAIGRARISLGTRVESVLESLAEVKALKPGRDALETIARGVLLVAVLDRAQGGGDTGKGGTIVVAAQAEYDPAALGATVRKVLVDPGVLSLFQNASNELQARLSEPATRDSSQAVAALHEYLNGLALWISGSGEALRSAAAAFSKAIAIAPGFAPAWSARGTVRMAMYQPDDGLADLAKAVSLNPKSPALLRARAAGYAAGMRYDRAEADVAEVLRRAPGDAAAHDLRGELMAAFRRPEAALAEFDQALRLMPNYAAAHHNRGTILARLERSAPALREFDQALRLDPSQAVSLNNRGNLYARLQSYEKALKDFDEAIRLDPRFAAAFNNRGEVYRAMGQGERAIRDFDEAIRLRPSYANAYLNRAAALDLQGKMDPAFKDLEYAAQLTPDSPYLFASRGSAYARLSLPAKACQDWRKACTLGAQSVCGFLQTHDICGTQAGRN